MESTGGCAMAVKGPVGSQWIDPLEPMENWHKDFKKPADNQYDKSIPWPMLEAFLKKKLEESRDLADNADSERAMYRAQGASAAFKLMLNLPGILMVESTKEGE
jgi:hypothetical protein